MFLTKVSFYKMLIPAVQLFNLFIAESAYSQQDSLSTKKREAVIQMFKESYTEGKLEYRVSLIKDTFLLYEPVVAEVWLKNISKDTLRVFHPLSGDWLIEDNEGKRYLPKVQDFQVLQRLNSGDSLGGVLGIQDYGVSMPPPYPYPSLPLGKYRAIYRIQDFNETLAFYVVEPRGREAEALKLYLNAFEPSWGKRFSKVSSEERVELAVEMVKKLATVADRYPKSRYSSVALTDAVFTAWSSVGDGALAHRLTLQVLREFPQKYWACMHILGAYYETKHDTLGFKNELDSIIRVNSHPRLTTAAKQELKKLEGKK